MLGKIHIHDNTQETKQEDQETKKYVLVLYVHCREDNKYYIQKGVAMRRVLRLTEIMCLMNNEQIAFGLK